ncbi:MAG: type II toxin-antitoxin system VapB family antitoxin [Bacteroidota bacterium]
MRTNIVIDDNLMRKALNCSGLKTKKAVVEEALRLLIKLKSQARLLELKGKVKWEGNLDDMRADEYSRR